MDLLLTGFGRQMSSRPDFGSSLVIGICPFRKKRGMTG
jgi:hypothetical protein